MIARKTVLVMSANIIEAFTAYVALFFISRYMGPGSYGIIGFAIGFVGLFSIIGNLGFGSAHIKNISKGKDKGTCIGAFITVKTILTTIMSISTLVAILIWKELLKRGFESPIHETAVYIILGYYVLEQLSGIFQNTFIAETQIAKNEAPIFIAAITRTLAIIYVALNGYGPIELAFAYVFGHIFLFITGFILFFGQPVKKPSKTCLKEYMRFACPLIIVSSASLVITNTDKVLIQLFWSSEEVGYYFASYRLSNLIVVVGSSISLLLFPTFSNLNSVKKINDIKNLLKASERYISMFTTPMAIFICILAEPIIHIFLSDSFLPAILVFQILPFYSLLYALVYPYESLFLGLDKPNVVRNRFLLMALCNIILDLILIPKDIQILGLRLFGFGAVGASIATVISYIIGLTFYKITVWRTYRIGFNTRILLHFMIAIITGAFLYCTNKIIGINRWYTLLGVFCLGTFIYLVILYILKEFTKEDVQDMIKWIARFIEDS